MGRTRWNSKRLLCSCYSFHLIAFDEGERIPIMSLLAGSGLMLSQFEQCSCDRLSQTPRLRATVATWWLMSTLLFCSFSAKCKTFQVSSRPKFIKRTAKSKKTRKYTLAFGLQRKITLTKIASEWNSSAGIELVTRGCSIATNLQNIQLIAQNIRKTFSSW